MLENLDVHYTELLEETKTLYFDNLNNQEWRENLNYYVDPVAITDDEEFFMYQEKVKNEILELLPIIIDIKRFQKYTELMSELLFVQKEFLSLDTIGTVLNHLRELYTTILRHIKLHYI